MIRKSIAIVCLFCMVSISCAAPLPALVHHQSVVSHSDAAVLSLQEFGEQRLREIHTDAPRSTDAGTYHTYLEMTALFEDLAASYPEIMHLESLGQTYEEREIWMVKLSDNVDVDEDEPEILLIGAHHGNEKPSYEVLIFFIEFMVTSYDKPNTDDDQDGAVNEDIIDGIDNDQDGQIDEDPSEDRIRSILDTREIYLIPMMNADGVEAGTRKNCVPNHGLFGFRRSVTSYGVDLNRNYGYRWFLLFLMPDQYLGATHYKDSSNVYHGRRPFSEVETQAVKSLVEDHDFYICLTYHTYGQLILYPWGYTAFSAPDEALFLSIGSNISAINGYTVEQSVFLYPTLGDATDWMYGEHDILPYTIELGREYAPSDPSIVHNMCVEHTGVNMYVAEIAE